MILQKQDSGPRPPVKKNTYNNSTISQKESGHQPEDLYMKNPNQIAKQDSETISIPIAEFA